MTGENSGRSRIGLLVAVEDCHSRADKSSSPFFSFCNPVLGVLLICAGCSLSRAEQAVDGRSQAVVSTTASSSDREADASVRQNVIEADPRVPVQLRAAFVKDEHLDKTPPRETKGLYVVKMGWTYNCMECHTLLEAKWHFDRPLAQHQELQLDHGNNRFCLNCHHPTNRNVFVDYDGSEIGETEVVLLCAKCHGPTHRDWKAGVHGRRNGYWNVEKGVRTQLRCIQCHDPHVPKFKPIVPLAPPRYPERARQSHDLEHTESGPNGEGSVGQSSLTSDSASEE